jgi:F1F0 ATPase subunit 2
MSIDALLATAAGFVLGGLFYGGLWWTVRHLSEFRHPALTLLGSGVLRVAVVLAGFYAVAGGDWRRVLLCLLGFLIARLAVTWATRLPSPSTTAVAAHAP